MKKIVIFSIVACLAISKIKAQNIGNDSLVDINQQNFAYKKLIFPSLLMTYGLLGIESDGIKTINGDIKEVVNNHIDKRKTIDDFIQYVPALSVYVLNAMNIEGKHNFKDRTFILITSYILMTSTVYGLKKSTKIERPDKSSYDSFPSGHTASAFLGAEFLWQEYKDKSVWYGITGYVVATGTGIFRIYNDRHWLTDVAAGAGIGIISTKIAYWIQPFLNEKVFKSKNSKNTNALMIPIYNKSQVGMAVQMSF